MDRGDRLTPLLLWLLTLLPAVEERSSIKSKVKWPPALEGVGGVGAVGGGGGADTAAAVVVEALAAAMLKILLL